MHASGESAEGSDTVHPMTDEATESRATPIPNPPRYVPNPWVNGLGIVGFLALLAGAIVFLTPPAATDQGDGSSIVNFPSMYEQYGLALAAVIVGAALVAAWAVTGAREWRLEHPAAAA